MKSTTFYLLIVGTLFFFCCQETNAKKASTPLKAMQSKEVQKKVKKNIPKKWDSLKKHNVEAFFSEYGKSNKETKVRISTKFGDIDLLLYKDTPIHRANFIFLTKIGYFNTTVFYRVAKNFVVQGGNSDDIYTMKQRHKYGNYLIKPEFKPHRKHKYGALAAARHWENNPNMLSSPFEFYMVQDKKGAHHLNNLHTVFGEVTAGFSTLEKISKVEVGVDEWPKVDVKMTVSIVD